MTIALDLYMNYFSMAAIIATIFNLAVVTFFLLMPKKDGATWRFMLIYLFISIQNIGYLIASLWYNPLGAYHRWLAVFSVFPGLIYMTQFFFYFPMERNVRVARRMLIIQWAVAIVVSVTFAVMTVHAEKVFRFDGHYWDFDVDPLSYTVSLVILGFIAIVNVVAIWRVIVTKGRYRRYVLYMMGSFIVIGVLPGVINALSRKGILDRETFHIIWNLITVLGFFLAVTIYINITRNRTTIMTNVMGISLVTFLLLFQGLSYYISRDREEFFDEIHRHILARMMMDPAYRHPGIRYFYTISDENETGAETEWGGFLPDEQWRLELRNTIIHDSLASIPDARFTQGAMDICEKAHPYFEGYGRSIIYMLGEMPNARQEEKKAAVLRYSEQLNNMSRYHAKKIRELPDPDFERSLRSYLDNVEEDFRLFFSQVLVGRLETNVRGGAFLRSYIEKYLSPFCGSGRRIYRKAGDDTHFVGFIHAIPEIKSASEAGFSYRAYRRYIHESTIHLVYLLGGVMFILLVIFPLFFVGALMRPLRALLEGMRTVNRGDLDIAVPIRFKDEIGYLSHSFNVMVKSVRNSKREIDNINHYLKNIIDSMPSVLVSVDSRGRISHWNMAAEKKTGVNEKDAMGRYLWDLMPQFDQYLKNMMKTIGNREPQKLESIVLLEKNEIRYSDMMVYPLIADGVEGAVIRIDDITLRRRLEEMMIQTEKMMSVGGLAAGMAHEINNPLSGMLLAAQNIARRLSGDFSANHEAAESCGIEFKALEEYLQKRDVMKMLEDMREMGERASLIVNNMLNFSRRSESKTTETDLAEMLDRTVNLAASEYDLKRSYDFRHIEIVRDFESEVPGVHCIAVEIQQVILNLLKNAAHAMHEKIYPAGDGPKIVLRLGRAGKMVVIEVEDNGPGMSEENRKRVFEPFFTTKEAGKGTGLGLSVSYFIITDNHQGSMEVESMAGKGTRFIIGLPIKRDET